MGVAKEDRWRWARPWSVLAAVPLAAAMAMAWSPQAASGANVVNETYNLPLTVDVNSCTTPPDPVALSGKVHVVITTTANGTGGYNVRSDSNYEGVTGTGLLSGDTYSDSDETVDQYSQGGPFPVTHYVTDRSELISHGGDPNMYMYVTMQDTVAANGVTIPIVRTVTVSCHG